VCFPIPLRTRLSHRQFSGPGQLTPRLVGETLVTFVYVLVAVVAACNIPLAIFLAWVVFDDFDGFIETWVSSSPSGKYRHFDSNTREVMNVFDDPVSAARGFGDEGEPEVSAQINVLGFLVALSLLIAGQVWLLSQSLHFVWAIIVIATLLAVIEIRYVRRMRNA